MALELAFLLALSGKGGEQRLCEEVLKVLPPLTGGHDKTITGALQALEVVSTSKLSKFCSKSAQGMVGATKELLHLMSLGRAPHVDKLSKDGVMHEVVQRLPRFCRATVRRNGADEELFGIEALSHLVSVMAERRDVALGLDSVTPFVVYRWILPPALKASVDGMVAEAVKACGDGVSAPVSSADAPPPPSKKQRKAAIKDEVADLFA